jgi:hypothetical protein
MVESRYLRYGQMVSIKANYVFKVFHYIITALETALKDYTALVETNQILIKEHF